LARRNCLCFLAPEAFLLRDLLFVSRREWPFVLCGKWAFAPVPRDDERGRPFPFPLPLLRKSTLHTYLLLGCLRDEDRDPAALATDDPA